MEIVQHQAVTGELGNGYPSVVEPPHHELHRVSLIVPLLLPTVTLAVTLAAYLTELNGWAWNLLAIPAVALPTAVASAGAEIALVPRVSHRFPGVSTVPLMAGVRWLSAMAVASLIVLLLGPPLVGSHVWWPWFPEWLPRIGATIGLIAVSGLAMYDRLYFRLLDSFKEVERRRGLERFLSREAVERVLAGDSLAIGGERRVVTVLFADLRDSTAIAEQMTGPEVVAFFNCYVGAMATAVFEQGGMSDKYLGDGLMAVFGVLPDPSEGAIAATRTALAIRGRLAELNRERAGAGPGAIRHGIGIHTGEVVLGAIGIGERSDYTAVGDTVNTASRLEGLTKAYAVDTLLSEETAQRLLQGEFTLRSLGATALRGRTHMTRVYQLG